MTDVLATLYLEAKTTPATPEGREWDVTIIGAKTPEQLIATGGRSYIKSANGRLYSTEAIAKSAPLWEGVKVYDNHLTQEQFEQKQGMRSPVTEWIGTIVNPKWHDGDNRLTGTLKIIDEGLAKKLKNAYEAGVLDTIGLSIDTFPEIGGDVMHEGQSMPVIEGFKKILSVDLVAEPAAGGGFNRLIASQIFTKGVKATMDKEEIVQLVRQTLAEALAGAAEDEPVIEAEAEEGDAQEATPAKSKKVKIIEPAEEEDVTMVEEADQKAQEALTRIAWLESRLNVERKLAETKLPETYRKVAQVALEGRVVTDEEIDKVLKSVKEAQAEADPSGRIAESGGGRQTNIQRGMDEADKYALEFARLMMGNSDFARLRGDNVDSMVMERLKEADYWKAWERDGFTKFTGQASRVSSLLEQWFGGNPLIDQRAMETATTSSLATVVKNTVNIMVATDYSIQQRWYEAIVRQEEVDTIDDSTLARLYGVATLDVVNEGAAYTELPISDEEETAVFVKKGNYIGITMETLMRDKLNFVRTIPRRLSDSWYNTLSALVAGVFTVNTAAGPVLSDTGALFNATATGTGGGHANLLTAALSYNAFSASRTAMRKQTNMPLGAGRKLQIEPRYLLVPEDLETTALQIRNSEQLPGSANNDVNPFYNKFDVITVPDWTDTTDWALVADPARFPAIYLIFPRGNRTPQLFTADSEVAGAMFTNDTLRFKVRMLTYRFSATYDCAPVADFRSLHKNNV